jgi:hypothetical protein
MMRKPILFSLLVLFSFPVFSQTISGVVCDKDTKKALPNVNVYLAATTVGTTTNDSGKFLLTLPKQVKKRQKLVFSCVGYSSLEIPIKAVNDTINLTQKIVKIDEVSIANKRILKPSLPFEKVTKLNSGLYAFGAFLKDDEIYIIGGDESLNTDEAKAFRCAVEKTGGELSLSDIAKELSKIFTWENYSNLLQVYNLKTNSWTEKDDLFEKRAYHNVELYKNKAYVLGGTRHQGKREYLHHKIEIFDTSADEITIDEVNPHQAVNFASGIAGDYLFMAGGSVKKDKIGTIFYTDDVHLLDIKTGLWYKLAPMISAKECKGIFAGSNFYIIGGKNDFTNKHIEAYDFEVDKWTSKIELPTEISAPALTCSEDVIYIFEDEQFLSYDIKNNVVRKYRINLNLTNAEMFYSNNKIYIVGGNDVDEYSNEPSRFIYSIDMIELARTQHKIIKSS